MAKTFAVLVPVEWDHLRHVQPILRVHCPHPEGLLEEPLRKFILQRGSPRWLHQPHRVHHMEQPRCHLQNPVHQGSELGQVQGGRKATVAVLHRARLAPPDDPFDRHLLL